jgi:NDP-sugar pyrophosphorylase family protein
MSRPFQAIVLAGGKGTRLRPLTFAVPKPLLPIREKPILEILLSHLRRNGCRRVVLATGYRAELIHSYFNHGTQFGLRIDFVQEKKPMGTAGPVRLVMDRFRFTEPVVVMNGDILTRVNFQRMLAFHRAQRAVLTIGMKAIRERLRFGTVQAKQGRVLGVTEKPAFTYDISAGIYVVSPEAMRWIPRGAFFDIPSLAERLIADGRRVAAYRIREYWMAVEQSDHIGQALRESRRWR